MATSNFSPDDIMNPVYCRQCRIPIPTDVSAQGSGICSGCLAKNKQVDDARQAALAQKVAIQDAQVRSHSQYSQSDAAFFFRSIMVVVVVCIALLIYHKAYVVPLERRLEASENKVGLLSQRLEATQNKVEETENRLDSLTHTVNHNAEAANANLRRY